MSVNALPIKIVSNKNEKVSKADQINMLVKNSNMPKEDFAKYYHISTSTLCNWLYGTRSPTAYVLKLLVVAENKRLNITDEKEKMAFITLSGNIKHNKDVIRKKLQYLPDEIWQSIALKSNNKKEVCQDIENKDTFELFHEVIDTSGLKRVEFSRIYEIPSRTLTHWLSGERKVPEYIVRLLWDAEQTRKYYESYIKENSYIEKVLSIVEFTVTIQNGNYSQEYKKKYLDNAVRRLQCITQDYEKF